VPPVTVCALTDAPGRLGGSRQLEEDFDQALAVAAKEHPDVSVVRQVLTGAPRAALLSAAADAQLPSAPSRLPARLPELANFSCSQA
jgi:hypothetical protein